MASGNDLKAHQSTYAGFLNLAKWSAGAIGLITALVVYLIAS